MPMIRPDYNGGSIVNLMASVVTAMGGRDDLYPPLRGLALAPLRQTKNLVLLVIDGLGYEYLMEIGRNSALSQHLEGRITSVFPPTTATAVPTFLTGMATQQHALTGWFTYFKELDKVVAVLPFQDRRDGASLTATGVHPSELFDQVPVFDRIEAHSYIVIPQWLASSEFNLAHQGAATLKPYTSLKQFFKTIRGGLRTDHERKYIYAYWPELDRLAHVHGIGSEKAAVHFAEIDGAFGRFLHAIAGSETTVIVTADHGFIDSGPERLIELAHHPRLAETLMLPLCGDSRVAYCYVHPAKRAQFEHYAEKELAEYAAVFPSAELLQRGYFGLGPPHPRLLERIGHYTLVMKENYAIKDWLPDEQRYVHIGMHSGVSKNEMYVPLIVAHT